VLCGSLFFVRTFGSRVLKNQKLKKPNSHYEKKGCFTTGLATQFLSCRRHLQLIAIQLQLNQNNSFSTIIQCRYNYIHDVMLTSLLVIHLLNFDTWHFEDFST
jgi:hypothetical protein